MNTLEELGIDCASYSPLIQDALRAFVERRKPFTLRQYLHATWNDVTDAQNLALYYSRPLNRFIKLTYPPRLWYLRVKLRFHRFLRDIASEA
jgi:hypothetical protein